MNFPTLTRTAVTGIAAMTAVFATAQAAVQTQTLLITDSANHTSFSGIHKIDLKTGKYLGYIGGLALRHARAIAILPNSTTAYVGDDEGIKRIDINTGNMQSLMKGFSQIGGFTVALRFKPDTGDLYAVVVTDPYHYKVLCFSGTSGTIKSTSSGFWTSAWLNAPVSLGFSTFGSVEVVSVYGTRTYRDIFTPSLSSISTTFRTSPDGGDFRSSSDQYLRYMPYFGEIRGGEGDIDSAKFITPTGLGSFIGAAEGQFGKVFMLTNEGATVGIRTFDTSGHLPMLTGLAWMPYFKHDSLNYAAISIR